MITYDEAQRRSTDPDDLSLKLRKMFPNLESEGNAMTVSTADFSEIAQLREYRRLFEEQEEKTQVQLQQKDELVDELRQRLSQHKEEMARVEGRLQEALLESKKLQAENERTVKETQKRTEKLMERVKQLNQRLANGS